MLQSSDNMEEVLDISSENLQLLKEEAQMVEQPQLMRYIRIFSELSNQIRYALQKRVMIEIALIKLCRPEMERDYDSLVQRIARLEQQMEEGIFTAVSTDFSGRAAGENALPGYGQEAGPGEIKTGQKPEEQKLPQAIPEDIKQVVKNWRSLIEELSGGLKNYLKSARLSLSGDNQLLIVLEDEVAEAFVNSESHIQELKDIIGEKTGKAIEFKIQSSEGNRPFEENYPDIGKIINMEITVEED